MPRSHLLMHRIGSTSWWGVVALALAVLTLLVYWRPWDREYSNEQLVELALHDSDEQQRTAAASELASRGVDARTHLRQVLAGTKDAAVLAVVIQGLAEIWDHQSMPAFIEATNHETLLVRGRATRAVQKILGVEVAAPADDSKTERQQRADRLQKEWQARSQSPRVIERLEALAASSADSQG